MSFPPVLANARGQRLESGDLGGREVGPVALAQQRQQVDRRVRGDIGQHHSITAALALAASRHSDLAHTARAANLDALAGIGGHRIDDGLALLLRHAGGGAILEVLRRLGDGMEGAAHRENMRQWRNCVNGV